MVQWLHSRPVARGRRFDPLLLPGTTDCYTIYYYMFLDKTLHGYPHTPVLKATLSMSKNKTFLWKFDFSVLTSHSPKI